MTLTQVPARETMSPEQHYLLRQNAEEMVIDSSYIEQRRRYSNAKLLLALHDLDLLPFIEEDAALIKEMERQAADNHLYQTRATLCVLLLICTAMALIVCIVALLGFIINFVFWILQGDSEHVFKTFLWCIGALLSALGFFIAAARMRPETHRWVMDWAPNYRGLVSLEAAQMWLKISKKLPQTELLIDHLPGTKILWFVVKLDMSDKFYIALSRC